MSVRKSYLHYSRPHVEAADVRAVLDVLQSGWLTTGPKTEALEAEFIRRTGIPHALALNSCTSALQLALAAFGVGAGDEVILPSLTFVASAECVRHLGAEPVFCDVDDTTLCITPRTVAEVAGPRTRAIIPMHYGGQPADVRTLMEFAQPRQILVIEDAAHALGTVDNGKWPGFHSDAAAFSFYATKNITCGEGGMLLTQRSDLAEKAATLSLHGMDRDSWKRYTKGGTWKYDVVEVGYKCNMPDIAAAMALSQLQRLESLQAMRNSLASRYLSQIKAIRGVRPVGLVPKSPDQHSWCIFAILVDEAVTGICRDDVVEELRLRNIASSVHFIPTHTFSAYKNLRRADLSATERIAEQILSLPLYPGMTDEDVDDVVGALSEICGSREPDGPLQNGLAAPAKARTTSI